MKKKLVLLVTAVAICATMLTPTAFAAGHDPYEGFLITAFDTTTATGYNTSDGRLSSSGINKLYTYENIDFGDETVTGVTLGIGTDASNAGSKVSLYLDSATGTPIATFTVLPSGWSTDTAHYCEINAEIKGVHTLYLHTGNKPVNFFGVRFHKKPSANDVYDDYNSEKFLFEDISLSEYRNDISVIYELGLSGKDVTETMYYPDTLVTRARFAEVMHLVLGGIESTTAETPFIDVSEESEFYSAIITLKQLGIISGFGDGSFRPDDFISVKDAVSAVCRMLGYDAIAQSKGGYSVGYLAVAKKESLTDGILTDGYLTEGSLARLVKNAIDTDCYEIKGVNTEGVVDFVLNENGILSMHQNIYRTEGLVSMNNVTGVSTPETEFDDARIKIGNEMFFVGETQGRSLVGYECEIYYLVENDKKTILSIHPLDSTVVTDIQTNVHYVNDISLDKIEYEAIEGGREKKLSLEPDCHILYNGVALDSALDSVISDQFRGRIRYVDNRRNKDVLFVDEYVNIIIGSANKNGRFVYDELGRVKHIFSDEDKVYFTRDGASATWGDVHAGDIAMMYVSKNQTGNVLARFVVTTDTVSGVVKSINNEGIVVDGKLYKVARECTDAIPLGTKLEFKLNAYNEVVSFNEIAEETDKIAWLIKCGTETKNAFSRISRIRVLDTDNEIRNYVLDDNCVVDGRRYKNSDVVLTSVMEEAPVRYVLNSEGHIIEMDTIVGDAGGDKDGMVLAMDSTSSLYWNSSSRMFMSSYDGLNKFILSQDGKILAKWDDTDDSESFEWVSTPSLSSDGFTGKAYSFDFSEGYADVFVYERKSVDRSYTRAFAVDMLITSMDEVGNICEVLCGYDGLTEVKYPLSEDYPESVAKIKALKKGDWVSLTLDGTGYVRDITIIYLANGSSVLDYTYDGTNKTHTPVLYTGNGLGKGAKGYAIMKFVYGTVVDRNGKYVLLQHEGSNVTEYIHLGNSTALKLGEREAGTPWLENGVSTDSIVIGDKVLFEIASRATRSVYIIGQ